ncbi:MAG: hypothetical protein PHI24_09900 [Desulfitobacteriaceae bacterium]|nr:hypothetical protein [Desulfitobacteriaceae bacterium]
MGGVALGRTLYLDPSDAHQRDGSRDGHGVGSPIYIVPGIWPCILGAMSAPIESPIDFVPGPITGLYIRMNKLHKWCQAPISATNHRKRL